LLKLSTKNRFFTKKSKYKVCKLPHQRTPMEKPMSTFCYAKCFAPFTNLIHAVTTKSNQMPLYGSLALHTGEPHNQIINNRQKIVETLKWDNTYHFVTAQQTHSDRIAVIQTSKSIGWSDYKGAIEQCDGLITNQKGVILTILTADCVPLLLFDPRNQVIGALHAGWRGTQSQIASKTVAKMTQHYGTQPKDLIAYIGPSIKRCCYEVDKTVMQHFQQTNAYDKKGDKYMLDLPHINFSQLLESNLQSRNIETSPHCTACDTELFFSYRKEKGCSGRFMSMIGLAR